MELLIKRITTSVWPPKTGLLGGSAGSLTVRGGIVLGQFLAVLAICCSGGCTHLRNYEPAVDPSSLPDTAFLHYLGTVPVVSVDEGYRAMLIVSPELDSEASFAARQEALLAADIVREAWNLEPNQILDKGTLAFMAVQICDLPVGVDSLAFGSWGLGDRRYALKDAVDAGLLPYDVPYRAVRGGELVGVLTKMDAYLAEHGQIEATVEDVDSPADLDPAGP